MNKRLYILPHAKGWAIQREGNRRVSSIYATKNAALAAGKRMAQAQRAELIIHGRAGLPREQHLAPSSYIVADSAICHGQATFRGTRILVVDVLEQVASGLDWKVICEEWRGRISLEAIAEAVRLEREKLLPAEDIMGAATELVSA